MNHSDKLYRINDVLSALAQEFNIAWDDDDEQDQVLNDLTHEVADAFGLDESGEPDA